MSIIGSYPQSDLIEQHPLIRLVKRLAGIGMESALVKLPSTAMFNARCILQTSAALPKLHGYSLHKSADIWSKIVEDQGILSVWRGYPLDVMKSIIQFFLNPFAFAIQRRIVPRFNPNQDFVKFYLSSIGGGYLTSAFIQTCLRPLEYCRVKLALDTIGKREYTGALDVIKKTVKGPNGIAGIYSGFSVALVKTLVYRISYFALYDLLRVINPYSYDRDALGLFTRLFTGQFVALASLTLCFPFEVVERKMQAQADKEESERCYKDAIDCFKKTYKEEGVAGFFRGLQNNLATTIGTTVALFVSDMLFR
ncbi:predicted protein [Naegleria gruberi]|uniref:ADP/ATP translocase n=1 Tax=Naegleria gruberi TaxID=5762 RepID=D2VDY3_NAEGR|nr:uncharacterized protein NAEGRDRAFT_67085 [Naegleria gruberi]EFC45078.1 predicted protein [Naegleria gruberi]|eukprot:XP_002677822.1 predicted protein [Naegleria gruberi strain NEG-M]